MKVFERVYMREFALLLGECWLRANTALPKELGLDIVPYVIEEYRGGAIYYWEYAQGVQALTDAFLRENEKSWDFFESHIAEYYRGVDAVENYPEDTAQLASLIRLYDRAMAGWIVLYYSGGDGRTPADIRDRAMEIRAADRLGDDMDHLLRTVLPKLYPGVPSCVAILRDEIESPPPESELAERLKHSMLLQTGEKTEAVSVTRAQFIASHPAFALEEDVVTDDIHEVKGAPASLGRVRGKVKIITRRYQMSAFAEGEILVTAMTTPDYIPIMKKSAAIVTDEGGLTCHAAIFSRELKKPCIIGTKIATQVFKDGDMVEVDAEKGIVRKI